MFICEKAAMNYTSIKAFVYRWIQSALLYAISYYAVSYAMRLWRHDHNIVIWQTVAFVLIMTMYSAVIVPYIKNRGFHKKHLLDK